jgi:hypothetical protein
MKRIQTGAAPKRREMGFSIDACCSEPALLLGFFPSLPRMRRQQNPHNWRSPKGARFRDRPSSATVSRQNSRHLSSELPRIHQMPQEPGRLGHRCIRSTGLSLQTVCTLNALIAVFQI